MQTAVKGYMENGQFFPEHQEKSKTGRFDVTVIFHEPSEKTNEELEEIRQKRLAFFGCMEGKIWISDDFDAPLEEMEEYM